jgi:Na+/melibiose symporter-like transporter
MPILTPIIIAELEETARCLRIDGLSMKEQISIAMGLMLICVTLSLPFWQWLGKKMNKGPVYAIGMGIGAIAVLVTFFLPHQPSNLLFVLFELVGFGFAVNWIYPWAMVADVGDYDRSETGRQRSGMYYGVWGLATKLSEALALATVGWILSGFGYMPNVEQIPHALFWHPPVLWLDTCCLYLHHTALPV